MSFFYLQVLAVFKCCWVLIIAKKKKSILSQTFSPTETASIIRSGWYSSLGFMFLKQTDFSFIPLLLKSYVSIKTHLSSTDTPRRSPTTLHTLKATEIFTRSLAVIFNTSHIHFHSPRHAKATSFEKFDMHTQSRANNSGMHICFLPILTSLSC